MAPTGEVLHNSSEERFELKVDGGTAYLEYETDERGFVLTHTWVPPKLQGHGFGETLVRVALEHAREKNFAVVPACPFVKAFVRRHPEYRDVIHPRHRGAVELPE